MGLTRRKALQRTLREAVCVLASLAGVFAHPQAPLSAAAIDPQLRHGRELLAARQFPEAKAVFADYLHAHPRSVPGELGEGEAEFQLGQMEAAESSYRAAVAAQPELWGAHKSLVLVEAALGRWEEFDRERTVLRMARERGAPGISARESDLIDSFTVRGRRWVTRSYFEPVGRSQARYNIERFSADGRVEVYVSLEDAGAARAALTPEDVRIGAKTTDAANSPTAGALCLNWYTSTAHGIVREYGPVEPPYERLRADVRHWLEQHPEIAGAGHKSMPEQDPTRPALRETHTPPSNGERPNA